MQSPARHRFSDSGGTIIGNQLVHLAKQINAEHEAGEAALRKGAEHYLKAGQKLLEAKARCKRGEWLPWLRENISFSQRTVSTYMQLVRLAATSNLSPEEPGKRQ